MSKYQVIAYYYLGGLEDPQGEIEKQKNFFKERDMLGRLYLSEQGINGQMSALSSHAEEYVAWMHLDPRFREISFKMHPSSEHVFPKATIKYRRQLVAIDCDVDLSLSGEKVSPTEWKNMLEEKDEDTLIIDVRNDYESKVGHFEGATLPPLETFRQFPLYISSLKREKDPKKTRVMMSCTGGIRCGYYSALMKQEGFEKVYQLDGGVIQYGLEYGSKHWRGKLFVFDDRLTIPLSDDATTITTCRYCEVEIDVYYNCANMDCNGFFTSCKSCLQEHRGCCSSPCKEGRVRELSLDGKPFRRRSQEEKMAVR